MEIVDFVDKLFVKSDTELSLSFVLTLNGRRFKTWETRIADNEDQFFHILITEEEFEKRMNRR